MALKDTLKRLDELELLPIENGRPSATPPSKDLEPGLDSMMKYPLPPVSVSPDSLRQYYRGGQLPQKRIISSVPTVAGGNSVTNTTVNQNITNSNINVNTLSFAIKQASVTTYALANGQIFTAPLVMGKVFQVLGFSCSQAARVELYGSALTQTLDSARPIDTTPAEGTVQGLVFDAVVDTFPYRWTLQNVVGTNIETPTTNLTYISVTNEGNYGEITVTLSYVAFVL